MKRVIHCLVFVGVLGAFPCLAEEADSPNIVLIISDDQGFHDFGFMGHPVIETPHLDRLAEESLVFTRGYVTTALCNPSLSSMLTGLYPHQHGYTGNDPAKGKNRADWINHFRTLHQMPRLLSEAGYLTLHTGKYWQGNPERVSGFTDSMGETLRHGSKASLGVGRNTMQPIYDFIEKAQDEDKPFLVWYAPFLPHQPHTPPERLLNKYKDKTSDEGRAKYFAMVDWLDETCGELMQYLDDHGLRENTVVMYINDNGWPHGDSGFRGHKQSPWEQGVRTPVMVRWPGKVTPGRDETSLVSNLDIPVTALAAAGVPVPETMEGINLLDKAAVKERECVFIEDFAHDMTSLDKPAETLEARGVICGDRKLVEVYVKQVNTKPGTYLFNLKEDPKEKTNLAGDHPQRVEELKRRMDDWWDPGPSGLTTPWVMHKIDNAMWNHNSLSPGDVNRDGHPDYAVIHEGPNTYTFILHPGGDGDVKAPWKKVTVGEGHNPEYSDFGDFDGDGFLDIVGVGGEGAGARIFWGAEPSRVTDPSAWKDSGLLAETRDRGHFLYVRTRDLNRDGAPDIVIGGRVQGTHSLENVKGKRTAGIIWIEAPASREDRRDPARWVVHDIDSKTKGGHGFQFSDVDGDGDEDIINCNADWNTHDSEEHVVWYENPGGGSTAQKREWPRHVIYEGGEFFSKANVAVGDLDGDGLVDVCVPTTQQIFYFRKTSVNPVKWEKIVIPKDEKATWWQRPLAMADLNADGRMDLVGMLIHDFNGKLPSDKAAVYMMTYAGKRPAADNWSTHVIKWGDGADGQKKFRGEKWDHCRFSDVDGDGDIDIVGNCEEHYDAQRKTIIGVVWFENPMISSAGHSEDGKRGVGSRTGSAMR